jgi:hypothetical protein
MKTGGGVMSKAVGTTVVLARPVIVMKPEDSPCRENDTRLPRPSEVVIPITRSRPINLERSHQMINDPIDPQEQACRCGARATRGCRQAQCRKCRRRNRWDRHQDGARRHRRGEQW